MVLAENFVDYDDSLDRSESSSMTENRWTRVRQAYQSGELDRQHPLQSNVRRQRRNAVADTSAVSNSVNSTSQKYRFHQLAERVRELQNDIVPDLRLYQRPSIYSSFSATTPSSNVSPASLFTFSHQHRLSLSSPASVNSPVNLSRIILSPKILERAHQIPERFWLDWQQKQMQEQIDELEQIKTNLASPVNRSVPTMELDERPMNESESEIRRKRFRSLRAPANSTERDSDESLTSISRSHSFVEDLHEAHDSFDFDQRSDDDPKCLKVKNISTNFVTPTVLTRPPIIRSSKSISLPFTYLNSREPIVMMIDSRVINIDPKLMRINSDRQSNNDEAGWKTTSNCFGSHQTVEHRIEFQTKLTSPSKPLTIAVPIAYQRELSVEHNKNLISSFLKGKENDDDRLSPSSTLSFRSALSRLSSFELNQDRNAVIQSISVIRTPPSLSVSSHSSHVESMIIRYPNYVNPHSLEDQSTSSMNMSSGSISVQTDINVEQEANQRVSSSLDSLTSTRKEEKSFLMTRKFSKHHENDDNYSSNNFFVQTDSNSSDVKNRAYYTNQANLVRPSAIISHERTWKWKQNGQAFHPKVFALDNNDHVICSSSPSSSPSAAPLGTASVVSDCSSRRQRRKQTRLKKKIERYEERTKEEKKKKMMEKERNKKSPSSSTSEATEASLFQCFALDTGASFSTYEQANDANNNVTKKQDSLLISTSFEHRTLSQQQVNSGIKMEEQSHSIEKTKKNKENVRVFVKRRRGISNKTRRQRISVHSYSSDHSDETEISDKDHIEQLVTSIEKQLNSKKKKSRHEKHIIVVNYKPVFVGAPRQEKSSNPPSKDQARFPTDEECSSATHYSRRRSFTTTSSDGSPFRSLNNQSAKQPSILLDVPDVEDPLQFIEMMYQQLFTEDGRLRSGAEPTAFANCVKQLVTNSRRNSATSSPFRPKSTNLNSSRSLQQSRSTLSSSPLLLLNDQVNNFTDEEEEEEGETLVQTQIQRPPTTVNKSNNFSRHRNFNSRFSGDDTDDEDLDTFSDFNSTRYNQKLMQTSPSIDEDLTRTDSRLLSSSGYHSLERTEKPLKRNKALVPKSFSENDLLHSIDSTNEVENRFLHLCPTCRCVSNQPVIKVREIPKESSHPLRRFQQPLGEMLMKYLNFLLISKNVLLLPLVIFLLRQRSMYLGHP